jgi:hypothetical protein
VVERRLKQARSTQDNGPLGARFSLERGVWPPA